MMKVDRAAITRVGNRDQHWNIEYKMIEIKISDLRLTKYQLN